MSKRKTRNQKKLQSVAQQIETVMAAIKKAGGCAYAFFKNAAETLSASHFKHEREAAKFLRVVQDGLERHRGYKIPRIVTDFLQWLVAVPEPQAPKTHDAGPKPMMRRPMVHAHAAPAYG